MLNDETRGEHLPELFSIVHASTSFYGAHIYHLTHAMIPSKGNDTCGSDDPFGEKHPRDIRLQIYLSLILGIGAFLTFCASPPLQVKVSQH